MRFDTQKKNTLNRVDKSKKGDIDPQIRGLIDKINTSKAYYTTSSCAGRIDIIRLSKTKRKDEAEWVYVSHDEACFSDVIKSLHSIDNNEYWFKMESAIIHVCCRDVDSAIFLLDIAKKAGFKHSGILSIKRRIILEIFGSEKIEAIVARGGRLLVSDSYLKELILCANEKLNKTRKRIKKLTSLML